jgi:hypothetical protein
VNPFNWYRNWRIQRIERRIAYLERYCHFYAPDGKVATWHDVHYGIAKKQAKVAELRTKIYHLREF